MVYIIVNGLLVEAESVMEVHLQMEVHRRHVRRESCQPCEQVEDNSILEQLAREILNKGRE